MTRFLVALLAGALIVPACVLADRPDMPEPVERHVVQLEIVVYDNYNDITKACGWKGPGRLAGCAIPYTSTITGRRTGRYQLVLPQAKDWCDWINIKTWGHELLHAVGHTHSDEISFTGSNKTTMWQGNDCAFTE